MARFVSLVFLMFYTTGTMSSILPEENPSSPMCNTCCQQSAAGVPGIPGSNGLHGRDGERGEKGLKGDIGQPGVLGPPGPQGAWGPRGDQGEPGSHGERGLKGDKGEPGETHAAVHPYTAVKSAFTVMKTQTQTANVGDVLSFQDEKINIGSDFDMNTNKFTCQIQGTYVFSFTILSTTDETDTCFDLVINGEFVSRANLLTASASSTANHRYASKTLILHVTSGQQVWLKACAVSRIIDNENRHNVFTGFLLYPD